MVNIKDIIIGVIAVIFALAVSFITVRSEIQNREQAYDIVTSMKDVISEIDRSLILIDRSQFEYIQALYQFNTTNYSILCGINYFYETLTKKPYVEILAVKVESSVESSLYSVTKPRNKRTHINIKMKIIKNDSSFAAIFNHHCEYYSEVCKLHTLGAVNFMKVLGKEMMSNQRLFTAGRDLVDLATYMSSNIKMFDSFYDDPIKYFTIPKSNIIK